MLRQLLLTSSLLLLAGCNESASVFPGTNDSGTPLPPVNSGDGGAFDPTPGGSGSGSGTGSSSGLLPTGGSGGGSGGGVGSVPSGGSGGGAGGSGAAPVGGTGGGSGTGGGTPPGQPVPEPATMLLFGTGAAGLGWSRRRKARQQAESKA